MSHTSAQLEHIYALLFERFGKRHWWPADSPFEVIVGAVLTQNTAWTNVEKAIANLKAAGVLSTDRLHSLAVAEVARLIRPSGFYNQKAKRLKAVVEYLMDRYKGSIDAMGEKNTAELRDELLSIKGIGRETADSILLYACCKPVFVVDSYTYRVLSRHGLADERMTYDSLQQIFMDNLEHDVMVFNEYHALIVELAKRHCRTQPRCDDCPLSELPASLL